MPNLVELQADRLASEVKVILPFDEYEAKLHTRNLNLHSVATALIYVE